MALLTTEAACVECIRRLPIEETHLLLQAAGFLIIPQLELLIAKELVLGILAMNDDVFEETYSR
jgi:hypothetical protein